MRNTQNMTPPHNPPSFNATQKEMLYKTYNGLVANAVRWKLQGTRKEEIDDIISSVWYKMFEDDCARLKSFEERNDAQISTWLSRVAKNAAIDYLRKRKIEYLPLETIENENPRNYGFFDYIRGKSPDPLERLIARENRKEIILAVRSLPKIYRQVIYARFYQERSINDTAVIFGIADSTVYVRFFRGCMMLRKDLSQKEVEFEETCVAINLN